MDYLLVLVAGLFAGTLGGIVGTGSSLVLMPFLVVMFGPRQAVPIMAVAAITGNLGRVLAWRREIDWRACAAYCATAVPGAMLGARLLLAIPPGVAETALGVFFLALIPARRWLARPYGRAAGDDEIGSERPLARMEQRRAQECGWPPKKP